MLPCDDDVTREGYGAICDVRVVARTDSSASFRSGIVLDYDHAGVTVRLAGASAAAQHTIDLSGRVR